MTAAVDPVIVQMLKVRGGRQTDGPPPTSGSGDAGAALVLGDNQPMKDVVKPIG